MKLPNNNKLKHLNKLFTRILFSIAVIEVITAVIIVIFTNQHITTAFAKAVKYEPQGYTELYFENHNTLPQIITLNQPENFQFTIHNAEHKQVSYIYDVYLNLDSQKILLVKSGFTLKHNEKKTSTISYTITSPAQKGQIVVNLPNKRQSVHFWIRGSAI